MLEKQFNYLLKNYISDLPQLAVLFYGGVTAKLFYKLNPVKGSRQKKNFRHLEFHI